MAKVTRIKASDGPSRKDTSDEPTITRKKVVVKDKKQEKVKRKEVKKSEKLVSGEKKSGEKPFILFRPFVYLGRYIRDSWRELRQVRWPNRKATWKLVGAIFIYSAFFIILVMLLDALFNFIFSQIIR